jgi:hypothetical protein
LLAAVFREPLLFASPAVGVGIRGHSLRRAIVAKLGLPAVLYVEPSGLWPLFVLPYCSAVGVGSSDPDALAEVWSSGMERAEHSPFRIEPHAGQIPENAVEASPSESWGVLHEDVSWLHLANDTGHLEPEPASGAVEPLAGAGDADVLAREAARNDVNNATPCASVEGTNIIPYGERWQVLFILPLHESSCAECVDLHGAYTSPSEQVPTKYSSTSACEKCQLIHSPPPAASSRSMIDS